MLRFITILVLVLVLVVAAWFGTNWYAEYRLRTAFAHAGMSDTAAACMGHRLVQRLSLAQINELARLQEEKQDVGGLVRAFDRMDDPHIVKVVGKSVLLCSSGLSR
jgi:hypothetical protein